MSKYKQIKINILPEQHADLENSAREKNISIAQFVRLQLGFDLKDTKSFKKRRTDSAVYNKVDPEVLYHLSKIGNNINQIARSLNRGDNIDSLAVLLDIRRKLYDYKYM